MGAQARPGASAPNPPRSEWRHVRTTGLLVLENLAIAGGYVLLGWLGHRLTLGNRLPLIWPAAGFALAMLLVRGCSRWPAILLGALLVSSSSQEPLSALLMGAARTLAAVAGVQLIRRWPGMTRWPSSVRGVAGFMVIAGFVYPALASVMPDVSPLSNGNSASAPLSLCEMWAWFAANSAGTLVVTPAILSLALPTRVLPRRSRWEAALLGLLYAIACYSSFEFARRSEMGDLLGYTVTPPMLWAALRFGSRGAALNNVIRATLIIAFSVVALPKEGLTAAFIQLQARLMVLSSVLLFLGAAVEERHLARAGLEQEREGLERRVAERTRELAHSLSLLHSSLESTADGLFVVDRQGRITAMNRRFAGLWGMTDSIAESGDAARVLAFASGQVVDPEAFRSRVEELYAHPAQESEDEIELKSGRILERFSQPQRLGDAIIGRVWSFRDVTERRRAETERDRSLVEERQAREAMEQSYQEVQKALGLRDEFLAIAAHELKTPLTSMKAQIQHLERLVADNPTGSLPASRVGAVVAAASRQLRRFQALGDQLLDITRLTVGRLELRYEPLDFREFVAEQLAHQAVAAARAGSELRFESTGPVLGEWDRLRLEQIVGPLLSNAIKFGAGHPIAVRLEALGGRARFQVVDRGIGIAPEDQERIFQRLERAVDSRHYGGLGLGLWIVRQSAEALGGVVQVESAPGKGSRFTVELPLTHRPNGAVWTEGGGWREAEEGR
ncbi:MASE1 domain-containing protein [Pyxidicoccus parkwayensis]|uniref:histidine kinase n=1 Tax=Pyxidicoccus parkwayensis TaxID=2813578 RepID=A0ABX7P8G1_9BACT|nr:ATP-binding protein [Pyxidicoccus parkwaysis]QSQ26700.1 MASE1 domain-containing protein [Pyxidicoccus parkwaysis]